MSETYIVRKTSKKYKLDNGYDNTYPDRYFVEVKCVATYSDLEKNINEAPFFTIIASTDFPAENQKDCYFFCYSIEMDKRFKNLEDFTMQTITSEKPLTCIYDEVVMNKRKYGSPKLSSQRIHYTVINDATHEAIDIPLSWMTTYEPSPNNKFCVVETIK